MIWGMKLSAQADLGISSLMSPGTIALNTTGTLLCDIDNVGNVDVTAGCAVVTISVPAGISQITGVAAGIDPAWTTTTVTFPVTTITFRNTGGAILSFGADVYPLNLTVKGIAIGGPSGINTNIRLALPFEQGGCIALGNQNTSNDNGPTSITVVQYSWTGATNSDWSIASNWSPTIVPTSIDNVIIPNVPNKPQLTTNSAINNINVDAAMLVDINSQTFTINGAITGTGKLKGSPTSNLTIGGAAGTLLFDQTSSSARSLKALLLQGPTASASLAPSGDDIEVYESVILQTGSSFNFNNQNVTLKSTGTGALQSAYIGNLTGASLTNAGSMTKERYIATPRRAWHLLSAWAVTGSQTIKEAWQENGGPYVPGAGTLVTSNLYSPTNGFDMFSNSASVLTHNQGGLSGASWNYNLSNTNPTMVSSSQSYMVFVRGDRSQTPSNVGTGPTVLRTRGTLTQGNQSAFISSLGTGRTLVGNPYASPIDLETVFTGTTNLTQDMLVWDAGITGSTGVGGFRVVERIGLNDYQATPSAGVVPDNTMRYIHAGQAFFLKTILSDGTANATVNFTESMKTANLSVVNPIVAAINTSLTANLMVVTAGNVALLADGIRVRYDASYNANTSDDILKMGNFSENISSFREGKKLFVEKRPIPTVYDTIFLQLGNMGVRNYRFELATQNFMTGFTAYLQDSYKGTTTPIDLTGNTTEFDFSINAEAASANPDRFRIVFALKNIPVTKVTIKAAWKNEDIAVDWKAAGQFNINHYDVEKSTDGTSFNKVASQNTVGVNGTDATYTWLDVNVPAGTYHYRIRAVSNNGEITLSNKATVTIEKGKPAITVYPNPVSNRIIALQMSDMEKGFYVLNLINTGGQVVMTTQVNHGGGNATLSVPLLKQIANGAYRLEITKPDKSKLIKELVIANY